MISNISTRKKTATQQFPLTWKRRFPLIHHTAFHDFSLFFIISPLRIATPF